MKVKDVMVGTPVKCYVDTNLGSAVELFWRQQCGILPVSNAEQKIVGVVTDRDLCVALGTRNRLPGEIKAGEVMTGQLYSCRPEDEIQTAMATMAERKVRRLPVIDAAGNLQGILSMDDIALHAEPLGKGAKPPLCYEEVMETFKRIYAPPLPELVQKLAAAA